MSNTYSFKIFPLGIHASTPVKASDNCGTLSKRSIYTRFKGCSIGGEGGGLGDRMSSKSEIKFEKNARNKIDINKLISAFFPLLDRYPIGIINNKYMKK
jgi:hypothetical protein